MKKILAAVTLGLTITLQACNRGPQTHVGEWKGSNELGFKSHIVLEKGGKGFIFLKDVKTPITYSVDYKHSPIWLDLIFPPPPGLDSAIVGEQTLKTIIEFPNDSTMKWMGYWTDSERRPTAFSQDDPVHIHTLKKVKE